MQYSIEVHLFTEAHNGKDTYFWSIVGNDGDIEVNCGFGWASSEIQAFNDGLNYYNEKKKKKNYK